MQVNAMISSGEHKDKQATVEYPPLDAENIEQLVENFGADIVFSKAKQAVVINLQSFIRSQIEAGKSPDEIQEAANEWRPGTRRPAKSAAEKLGELLAKMSPAEREALLQQHLNGSA